MEEIMVTLEIKMTMKEFREIIPILPIPSSNITVKHPRQQAENDLKLNERKLFLISNLTTTPVKLTSFFRGCRTKGYTGKYRTFQRDIVDLEVEGKVKTTIQSNGERAIGRAKLVWLVGDTP